MQKNLFKIFTRLILTNPDLLVHSILKKTKSYFYIKRKKIYRLRKGFVSPGRRTRLLLDHHLHLRLLFPFHFLLLFFPCLFHVHPFRLLPVGRFVVDVNDLLIGGPTAAVLFPLPTLNHFDGPASALAGSTAQEILPLWQK